MPLAYLVAEEQTALHVLQKLLPPETLKETGCEGSRYSAPSLARTILVTERKPVALLMNAHTTDETSVQERLGTLRYLLKQAAADIPFEVFLAVPELEAIVFQQKELLERITNTTLSEREWKLAKLSPRAFLTDVLPRQTASLAQLVETLEPADIAVLQQHPLLQAINAFLSSVMVLA
jgi:hypothetical protein